LRFQFTQFFATTVVPLGFQANAEYGMLQVVGVSSEAERHSKAHLMDCIPPGDEWLKESFAFRLIHYVISNALSEALLRHDTPIRDNKYNHG
jgi:hypothetical protein